MDDKKIILSAKDVEVEFETRGVKSRTIRKCSLDLYEGEIVAIVGESGSGKSVFTKCFLGLLDKNGSIVGGSIDFEGMDLATITDEKQWMKIRGHEIALVMQNPMTALNPLMTVGKQIVESLRIRGLNKSEAGKEAVKLLEKVGINDAQRRFSQYPHELSGGQRQRVMIAIACALRPKVLICDEPTTALDVTIQNQILKLIKDLKEEFNMSVIFITHDMGVVANVADRIAVMYAGQIIEYGLPEEIFYDPKCAYTWALLSAMPQLGEKGKPLPSIEGTPPNRTQKIVGDAFAPRNKRALKIDFVEEPPMFKVTDTHYAKTWYLDERSPIIGKPSELEGYREKMESVYYGTRKAD